MSETKALPLVILDGMLETLKDPGAWTKFTYARDADGNEVLSQDPRAECWCLAGARNRQVRRLSSDRGIDVAFDAEQTTMHFIRRSLQGRMRETVVGFNDHPDTTHADVIALLKDARADIVAYLED